MEGGIVKSILLMYVITQLFGGVYLTYCPRYIKHEAITKGLLNHRAICRAAVYDYNEEICLNGFKSIGTYCATGSCNIFGYNCDGHCLTGADNIDEENDYLLKCDTTAQQERDKLCKHYINQFVNIREGFRQMYPSSKISTAFFVPSLENLIEMYGWQVSKSIQENMKSVCPWNVLENI